MTFAHRTPHPTAALLLLALALPAQALAPPRSIALQAGAAREAGRPTAVVALEAGHWLDGDVEALVALRGTSALAAAGHGASAVTPWLGLRWTPGLGRWRPWVLGGAGLRVALEGGRAAGVLHLGAGLDHQLWREVALCAGVGGRWTDGAGLSGEALLGLRLGF